MHSITNDDRYIWKFTPGLWIFGIVALVLIAAAFHSGISVMVRIWGEREEYSYGYLIPFITLFLVWQRRDVIENSAFTGSWAGIIVILLGWVLFVLGTLITFSTAVQVSMLIVLMGIMLSVMGWQAFRPVFVPVLFLAFMIPLPGFFLFNLSAQLQLISSSIGVDVIRLFGISVFLEGNVIDLGSYKLQVVEACSGLRYLFPLMSLAFICAYFFKGAMWKKAIIFLSSIPITVLMNSFRIGVIGVLVEYWGPAQAEGFLHDFEGWVVFMSCLGIILLEIWILARVGKQKLTLGEVFNLELPPPPEKDIAVRARSLPKQTFVAGLLLVAVTASSFLLSSRTEVKPLRSEFTTFPLEINGWHGRPEVLEKIYLDILKLDDYFLANYTRDKMSHVNLYIAYYETQKVGESAHSPRTCIPGGGWQITSMTRHDIKGVELNGLPLTVNRLMIQKGDSKQLVYYWFQQRGKSITNEYAVKWHLLKDAIALNRSDGALVRLTTMIPPGGDVAVADKQLAEFTGEVVGRLKEYIPD